MLDLALNDDVFIYDELSAAIQELDLLFDTTNTELINNPDYGTDWYQFLWVLNPSIIEFENYVKNKIKETYFASQLETEVSIEYNDDNTGMNDMYRVIINMQSPTSKAKSQRIYMI